MDVEVVLAQPPCSLLEAEVLSYARGALENGCSLEEAAEVLGPFLLDARLARDEAEALELLSAARGGGSTTSGRGRGTDHDREGGLLAAPVSIASLSSCGGAATAGFADELPLEGVQAEARRAGEGAARLSAARRAARASEAVVRALAPGQLLELWGAGADEEAVAILARALRSEWDSWAGGCDPDFLAASFFAYCAESLAEGLLSKWSQLLLEVLKDAGHLHSSEDADNAAGCTRVVTQLVKKGVLQAQAWAPAAGDQVLAVLPEDQEWHLAVVDSASQGTQHPAIADESNGAGAGDAGVEPADLVAFAFLVDDAARITFLEYGRPLDVAVADLRSVDDVLDEDSGELQEGDCEMCCRSMLLTFHHLIPKDVHPTYLGKRLPRGVEAPCACPTRAFLNTYGLMICRPCHNTVHKIADNGVLATEYNTLAKLMEHPNVQSWVEYAKKQRATKRSGR